MEYIPGILIPLIIFAFLAAIIVVPRWLRTREREKLLDVIRAISEKGGEPSPKLLAALESMGTDSATQREALKIWSQPSPERDLRRGATMIALAAAIVVMAGAIFLDNRNGGALVLAAAALPGFLGLTQIGFWLMAISKRDI